MANATPGYIGPYRLLNVVHTAQAAKVWQAYEDGKKRFVGVKALIQKYARDREQIGHLKQEYAVGQKLDHKNVIEVYRYDVDRGIPYLAMEWFPAPNMKNRIQQGIEKITHLLPKIIERAAAGLAHFNQAGWVHRDIKPDNFLVADDGQVKLIDFGIAQRGRRGLGRLLAGRAKVQGTPSYMSPEQIRGGAVDERADVYSFGCTMYHLLVGTPPFTGRSSKDLLNKHLKAAPPSLEAANNNVTTEFSQLIRRTMAKDPDDRPDSMADVLVEMRMRRILRVVPPAPVEVERPEQAGNSRQRA